MLSAFYFNSPIFMEDNINFIESFNIYLNNDKQLE